MTTPRGDGVINVAVPYANGGQVTSTNLNDIVDDAEFNTNAVDDSSVGINGSGKLFVKDDGITTARILNSNVTTAKIADNNVTTAKILNSNVTLAKVANIADDRVLGNISGGAAAPSELTAANVVTMLGTSLINPTSVSASTDSIVLSNGLIIKFEAFANGSGSTTAVSFPVAFPNECYGVLAMPNFSTAVVSSGQTHYVREVSASGFTYYSNTASQNNFYIAIGR
jgi:hypothetical protein